MDKQTQKEFANLKTFIKDELKEQDKRLKTQILKMKIELQKKIDDLALMVKREFDRNSLEHEQNRKEHEENRKEHEENRKEHEAILNELTEIKLELGERAFRGDYIDLEGRVSIIEKELVLRRSVRHS